MLDKDSALILIKQYMEGWKKNDLCLITSTLDDKCIVIESHGPTYYGIDDIQLWFNFWIAVDSKILRWDLTSYFHENNAAFIEWDFECFSNGIKYPLSGASIIKFSDKKINFIHEYRMKRPAFDWDKEKLISN